MYKPENKSSTVCKPHGPRWLPDTMVTGRGYHKQPGQGRWQNQSHESKYWPIHWTNKINYKEKTGLILKLVEIACHTVRTDKAICNTVQEIHREILVFKLHQHDTVVRRFIQFHQQTLANSFLLQIYYALLTRVKKLHHWNFESLRTKQKCTKHSWAKKQTSS